MLSRSATGTALVPAAVATNGCDADWNTWWVGSRNQRNVTKDFYMGLDVMYLRLQRASCCVSPTRPLAWRSTIGTPISSACRIRPGQLVVPVPRASRLLSLIA